MANQFTHNLRFLRNLPVARQLSLCRAMWKCRNAARTTKTSGTSAFGLKLATSFDHWSKGRLLLPVPSIAEEALVVEIPTQSDIVFALAAIYSMKTDAWTLFHSPKRGLAIEKAKQDIINQVPYPDNLLVESRLGVDAPAMNANLVLGVDARLLSFSAREETVEAALAGRRSIQAHGVYSSPAIRNPNAGAVVNTEPDATFGDRRISVTSDGCAFCARESHIGNNGLFADCAPLAEASNDGNPMTFTQAFGLPEMMEDADKGSFTELFDQFCSYLSDWALALDLWSKEIGETADLSTEERLDDSANGKGSLAYASSVVDVDYADVNT